ncbi:MAG: ABC transporter permease subunit [Phycisphaerae bacterium]
MNTLARDLGQWVWRLVPANPILVRVVQSGGKRRAHLMIRAGYLTVMAIAIFFFILFGGTSSGGSLAELAKNATQTFYYASTLQLFFVCIIAPIFAAAAITQEKDSQTFSILLSTPLTNSQIVLGSLLSRLYFVIVLLLASVPLYCITMVYGGVTSAEIALSIALAGATALITATCAIAISVIKVGTGRTIFSFYLAIFFYLLALWFASTLPAFIPPEARPGPGGGERMSWLSAFHPFLALWVVLNKTPAPDFAAVAHYGFPRAWWLAYPEYSFVLMAVLASVVLIAASVSFTRRGAKVGEPTWLGRLLGPRVSSSGGETTRRLRHVWQNPVAWREAETKAAAGSGGQMRIVLMIAGLLAGVILLIATQRGLTVTEARLWLKALVGIEIGLGLFVATATAAASMTREKEGNTLDLLLTTPLQSGQIISGKIRGLFSFAIPMLVLPAVTLGMFVLADLIRRRPWTVPPEVVLSVPLVSAGFTLLACSIGLWASVKQRRTVAAVLVSVSIVMAVFGVMGLCANQFTGSSFNSISAALAPFSPLATVMIALDPDGLLRATGSVPTSADLTTFRVTAAAASAVSVGVYLLISLWVHRDLVRNFDITIRKQSA